VGDWLGARPFPRLALLVTRLRSTSSLGSSSVLALVALVSVAALGLSACSSSSSSSSLGGDALVVNGSALSNKDFQAQLSEIQADADYVKIALTAQPDPTAASTTTTATTPNTYSTEFTTQVLNQRVTFDLAAQEVAKRGLAVSDDDKAKAQQVLANDLGTTTTDPSTGQRVSDGSGQKTLDALGSFKNTLIDGVADILAVQNDMTKQLSTDEALKTAYTAGVDTYKNQACVSALLLVAGSGPTQDPTTGAVVPPPDADYPAALARANDLATKVRAGTDIATLAPDSDNAKVSVTGTDLGCRPLGSLASQLPELDAAIAAQPVGAPGDPVKTTFGYFVVVVRSRGDLTFDQAKPQLTAGVSTAMKAAFKDWINRASKDADVIVDPQWGSWDKDNGTVIAPGGATSTTTTIDPNASTTTSLSPEQLQQLLGTSSGSPTSSTP
jgi:SurA N-terminal domain/PPIC-type PPIASE domain